MQQTISAPPRMEPEDQQHLLAEEYVQDFVLDHLEGVQVKSEEKRPLIEEEVWAQQREQDTRLCRQWPEDRRITPLSPPPDTIYPTQPVLVNMTLMADPGTPPETPPDCSPGSCRPPGMMGDLMWFPETMRPEPQPLDLRPLHCMGGEPDWERREYIPSGLIVDNTNHHIMANIVSWATKNYF